MQFSVASKKKKLFLELPILILFLEHFLKQVVNSILLSEACQFLPT